MKRNRIHILVVDDEASQGKALTEAFIRAGYQATWAQTSVAAITYAQRMEFQVLVVDCMLPRMNGVDLVEEILALGINKPKVFLISGIFKDKKFIKESLERTGAVEFFDKPLDLQQVLGRVDNAFNNEVEDDEPALLSLYSSNPPNDNELVRMLERESPMSSIHLPIIFRHLQRSALSGDLTVINSVGDMNTVSVWDGKIFFVRTPDKDSYFGGLAVSFGFVSPDDVMEALKTPTRALLGQKLIQSFALSPHAIHVIMEEQLALRLSQTVGDGVVSLQWQAKKYPTPDYALNPVRYEQLAADWINSKFSAEEIRTQLLAWGNFNIQGDSHPSQGTATTLQEFLNTTSGASDMLYLFHNLIRGHATLSGSKEEKPEENFTFLEHRLDKLLVDYKSQNYFQILGVGERAQSSELNKAYAELKSFDPGQLPKGCPPALMVKCTKVFQYIKTAYDTLIDDTKRNSYMLLEQNKRAQEMLESEPVFRAGILELSNGHPKEAAKKFQSLIDRKLHFKDLKAYRIWAGLKCDRNYKELTLDQVPPEERHSAAFMMAKGVYYRTRRQYQKAMECYRAAHVLDPRLSIAKQELKKLIAEADRRGNKDLLSEVTSVMENIFGKMRKSG